MRAEDKAQSAATHASKVCHTNFPYGKFRVDSGTVCLLSITETVKHQAGVALKYHQKLTTKIFVKRNK